MKKIAIEMDAFDASICEINDLKLDKLAELSKKILIANKCLRRFRKILEAEDFASKKDEINFFKFQKPKVQGRLDYYKKKRDFILHKPAGCKTKQRKFINKKLQKIGEENCKYVEFIKYLRLEKNELDKFFFLRGNTQIELFLDYSNYFDDPEFSTSHDYIVSKYITNELLQKYFNKQIEILSEKESITIVEEIKPTILNDLNWTVTKTDLIELLFALNAAGAINYGEADMKKLTEICKVLFEIDLGNIHKTFEQIKARKKDTTKFLDKLTTSLTKKINEEML